jgi:PKD repeat protein
VTVRWPSPGTKSLSASNAACGLALGSTTVEVQRAGAVTPPTAPTNLRATPISSTDLVLAWDDNSSNEDGFRVERLDDGVFREIGRAPANSESLRVSLADVPFPTTTLTTLRVVAFNAQGDSLAAASGTVARVASNEVEATTERESCDSDLSLCLLEKRFRVEATWVARNFAPGEGVGHPVALTEDTGYFWFFNPENVELVVKVLDGRAISNPPSYWVFFGALSNVEYAIRVTDTLTGNVHEYFNPTGQFASLGDTRALPSETLAATGGSVAGPRRSTGGGGSPAAKRALDERALNVDFANEPTEGRLSTDMHFEDLTQPPSALRARSWTFGDGTAALAARDTFARYRYEDPGSYDVTLQVIDLLGDFYGPPDAATRKVEITPPTLPALSVRGPAQAVVGEQVTFGVAADQSCSPAFRGWKWNVDGGTIVGRSNRPAIEVSWDDAGARTVTVGNSRCGDAKGTGNVEVVGSAAGSLAPPRLVARQGSCASSDDQLCLFGGRFSVRVQWKDFQNRTGGGHAERVSDETGYFWFFNEENVELIVKVLDGRQINGKFWVFYGALSNVEYTITVTDTATNSVKTYFNPSRSFGSRGDTTAFPDG